MSSDPHEKPSRSMNSAAEQLLHLLKMRGPHSASELGELVGTTGENARQQLGKLSRQGLVTQRARPGGVGRPVSEWRLTEAGHDHFPDAHAELAAKLIISVRDTLGPGALDRLVEARESETLALYRRELAGADSLRERVSRLARIRTREGYMAEWWKEEDGSLMLVENHCPICSAARTCPAFCRSELQIFRAVLGERVCVERTDHVLSGARRCTYRLTPR
ncbi:helix-turn-helix transcriptional regulator [Billgrantia endophytica]|uniref:MarR family transcriptional regulator n=1 Tax=Billgrantia endophytica TaxID=2033802 RepID=A0A2N7U1I5_9GAMM|nr:metalloregulator ArsR/SmtB family transcription factor [Halomonas endophytica]PMR74298.1 MarR family transcriptional regulator [Halomonas endophytica]